MPLPVPSDPTPIWFVSSVSLSWSCFTCSACCRLASSATRRRSASCSKVGGEGDTCGVSGIGGNGATGIGRAVCAGGSGACDLEADCRQQAQYQRGDDIGPPGHRGRHNPPACHARVMDTHAAMPGKGESNSAVVRLVRLIRLAFSGFCWTAPPHVR